MFKSEGATVAAELPPSLGLLGGLSSASDEVEEDEDSLLKAITPICGLDTSRPVDDEEGGAAGLKVGTQCF